jgi:nucleotide-binding universal stress UspA family protein
MPDGTKDAPILIAYDGSDDSRRAIDVAAALLGPRHAVVLDVAPTLTYNESLAAATTVIGGQEAEDLNAAAADEGARKGAELATRAGFTAESQELVVTPAWEGIVEIADEVDAAVIVIGSRGLKGIRERFEGSTSHEVAEHSRRPVLIVPPPPHTS